jgi:hypothetical protein
MSTRWSRGPPAATGKSKIARTFDVTGDFASAQHTMALPV